MENKENATSWLFGLEKFFQFRGEHLKCEFVRHLIQLRYFKPEDKPYAFRKLLALDCKNFPSADMDDRWKIYTSVFVKQDISAQTVFWLMNNIWGDEKFIHDLYLFFNNTDAVVANDLFSKSQVLSKIWMAEAMRKFSTKPVNVLLIGGWYGQHRWYMNDIYIKSITNVDLDGRATFVSKTIAERENEPYNVVQGDINELLSNDGKINIDGVDTRFDLVINTSGEHMDVSWFHKLPDDQAVLVQSNDMFDIEGHVNCVASLEEMQQKYPFKKIYTSGQLALSHGNRYMIYGSK